MHLAILFLFFTKNNIMNELVERITAAAGVTPEQAKTAVETVASYVKEKFPMMAGAVDQLFKSN